MLIPGGSSSSLQATTYQGQRYGRLYWIAEVLSSPKQGNYSVSKGIVRHATNWSKLSFPSFTPIHSLRHFCSEKSELIPSHPLWKHCNVSSHVSTNVGSLKLPLRQVRECPLPWAHHCYSLLFLFEQSMLPTAAPCGRLRFPPEEDGPQALAGPVMLQFSYGTLAQESGSGNGRTRMWTPETIAHIFTLPQTANIWLLRLKPIRSGMLCKGDTWKRFV